MLDDEVMKLVAKEFGTSMSSVAIIDAEEATLWPNLVLSVRRLGDVEDDGDSVFIIIPDQALISDGRVCSYNAIPFY